MSQLFCENEFCIYQKQGNCILERVKLDIQGNCMDCLYVNIQEDTLDLLKEDLLRNLEEIS